MLNIDLQFPHSYEVEESPELPGTGKLDIPLHYIPRPTTRPEHDGLWLKISPVAGESWVGVFAFGYQSPPATTRVVSSPDPDRICVVSSGAAYLVTVDEPDIWEKLPIMPVVDVLTIPQHQLIVFADFTRLAAYNAQGIAWRSPRLCWDELKIRNVTRDCIEGEGYDPVNPSGSRFVVDLRTGCSLLPLPFAANEIAL